VTTPRRSAPAAAALAFAALSAAVLFPAPARTAPDAGSRTVTLDPEASVLRWTGRKVTGSHHGTLRLRSGEAVFTGGSLTGGHFDVDMDSLRVDDLKNPESNAKLVAHLRSDDFFSVDEFPSAGFVIVGVKPLPGGGPDGPTHEIAGDLTIKGITRPVTIPAAVRQRDGRVRAEGSVTLDRTLWDVRYRSGRFFQGLGDKLIHDEFTVKLDLQGLP
jgi:polyisoprenoid-binding protein YceI